MHAPSNPASDPRCSLCGLRQLCLPSGLAPADVRRLEQIISSRRAVARGDLLYRAGQPFRHVYAVHQGQFKLVQMGPRGGQQVTAFPMAGDLLGLEAIGAGHYRCDAAALDDSEVCEVPFERLQQAVQSSPALARRLHAILSDEILRQQAVMLLRNSTSAEERLAQFLLDQGRCRSARGEPDGAFQLRMSREDIGGHMGVTMECVSRILARFGKRRWIAASGRDIAILDRAALQALATPPA